MLQMPPEKEPSILIGQLRLAVNVLTAGTCSDEGLEDATTLLLHLSRTEPLTRDSILELLLEGAQESANRLQLEIRSLLDELKERNAKSGKQPASENKVTALFLFFCYCAVLYLFYIRRIKFEFLAFNGI